VDATKPLITLFSLEKSQDKLKAVGEELGHQIRVFSSEKFALQPNKLPSADHGTEASSDFVLYGNLSYLYASSFVTSKHVLAEEDDDFYELQPADYFNLVSNRMAGTKYGFGSLKLL
jgi:tether containing UBX domain for GLUT4